MVNFFLAECGDALGFVMEAERGQGRIHRCHIGLTEESAPDPVIPGGGCARLRYTREALNKSHDGR